MLNPSTRNNKQRNATHRRIIPDTDLEIIKIPVTSQYLGFNYTSWCTFQKLTDSLISHSATLGDRATSSRYATPLGILSFERLIWTSGFALRHRNSLTNTAGCKSIAHHLKYQVLYCPGLSTCNYQTGKLQKCGPKIPRLLVLSLLRVKCAISRGQLLAPLFVINARSHLSAALPHFPFLRTSRCSQSTAYFSFC